MSQIFAVDESKPWFQSESGWPEQVARNFDFPKITLYEMLEETVRKHVDEPVMWFLDTWMTYGQFKKKRGCSGRRSGPQRVQKGRCAGSDSAQFILSTSSVTMPCARLGLIVTGVNPTYKPGEVLHQFRITGVSGVVILDALCRDLLDPILKDYPLEPDRIITTNYRGYGQNFSTKENAGQNPEKNPDRTQPCRFAPSEGCYDHLRTAPGCGDFRGRYPYLYNDRGDHRRAHRPRS